MDSPRKGPVIRKAFPNQDLFIEIDVTSEYPAATHTWLFAQPFVQAQIKENIKFPRHWPLLVEYIGERWITLIKGQ